MNAVETLSGVVVNPSVQAGDLTPEGGQPRGLDARDRILAAALELFSMRGFEGVSTTQIAAVAGITQPLIHYHFRSKEALWKAAVARAFIGVRDQFSTIVRSIPGGDRRRMLVEMSRAFVVFSAKNPHCSRLVLREGTQPSERLDWMVDEFLRPQLSAFYDLYLEGATEGWLKPLPFPQFALVLLSATTSFFSLGPLVESLYKIDPFSDEEVLKQSDLIVGVILAGMMTNPFEVGSMMGARLS